jgi:hypothetical protein
MGKRARSGFARSQQGNHIRQAERRKSVPNKEKEIVKKVDRTDKWLAARQKRHVKLMEESVEKLQNSLINNLNILKTKDGNLEGIKVNLKQAQQMHQRVEALFGEHFNSNVRKMVEDFKNAEGIITKSLTFGFETDQAARFTDIDHQIMDTLQDAHYTRIIDVGNQQKEAIVQGMYNHVIAGDEFSSLVNTIEQALLGSSAVGVTGRSLVGYARLYARDSIMNFHRDVALKKAEDIGAEYFLYYGDIIKTTRPFCRRKVGKIYSKKQIQSWTHPWQGKSGPALTHCGGWNCRHHWQAIKPEWLTEEEQELVQTPRGQKKKTLPPPMVSKKQRDALEEEVKKKKKATAAAAAEAKKLKGKPRRDYRTIMSEEKIKSVQQTGQQISGINDSYVVELDNGVKGIWKPTAGENLRPIVDEMNPQFLKTDFKEAAKKAGKAGDLAEAEVAAAEFDRVFNSKFVPTTVRRKITKKEIKALGLESDLDADIGSFQRWIDDAEVARDISLAEMDAYENGTSAAAKRFRNDQETLSMFDFIIGNWDRHQGNYMIRTKGPRKGSVVAIDNGFAFTAQHDRPGFRFELVADKTFDQVNEETKRMVKNTIIKAQELVEAIPDHTGYQEIFAQRTAALNMWQLDPDAKLVDILKQLGLIGG